MLNVLEVRDGVFEISDEFLNQDRSKVIFRQNSLLFIGVLFLSFGLIIVSNLINFIFPIILSIIFSIIGISSLVFSYQQRKVLLGDINGVVVIFDEFKKIIEMRTRRWVRYQVNEYYEEPIRYNQSIGFQALLDDEGDIIVEIIVDPNFPGTPIFRTYDLYTLAEFILLFQKILPDQDKWYYKLMNGDPWPQSIKSELNDEIQVARVPWQIRKYYGF